MPGAPAGEGDGAALPRRLTEPASALQLLLTLLPASFPSVRLPLGAAIGRVLAETLTATEPIPRQATAAWDGWAVAADDTLGAGAYSPAPLPTGTRWVRSGCPLPAGTDAVLPYWAVSPPPLPQASEAITAGEGVRQSGEDVAAGGILCHAGERLRVTGLPALHAAAVETVAVRVPRVALIGCGTELVADPSRDGVGPFLAALLADAGAEALSRPLVPDDAAAIVAAIGQAATMADLILLIGGTGEGPEDKSSEALGDAGRLVLHGLGSRPGASAGFGLAGTTPVVLVPGRWDDAYAVWLLLVRPALRHLMGARAGERARAVLTRKVASAVGLLDLVPVRRTGANLVEPLAVGALPPGVMAVADAVLLVPPAMEGYDTGTEVELELL